MRKYLLGAFGPSILNYAFSARVVCPVVTVRGGTVATLAYTFISASRMSLVCGYSAGDFVTAK